MTRTDFIFLIQRSSLEQRLEPKYYTSKYIKNEERLNSAIYPLKRLVDVTTLISDGTHFTPEYGDTGVKFVSVKDVRKYEISLEDVKFISEEEAALLDKRCMPQKGDVLLTKIGSFGYAAAIETTERFQIFVSVALLRPDESILPKFLEIFLNTRLAFIQFDRVIKGAGVPDLHLEDIRKIMIPVPPLVKQEQIATAFSEKYKTAKQYEAKGDALAKSIDAYLLDRLGIQLPHQDNTLKARIFTIQSGKLENRIDPLYYSSDLTFFNSGTYDTAKIAEIIHTAKSGVGVGRQDQAEADDGIIQIRPTNMKEHGFLNFEKNVYVPEEMLDEDNFLTRNDVLFNNTNSQELVGKTAIVKTDAVLSFSNHITRIRVIEEKVHPDYLCALLNSYQRHGIFYSICTNWNNQSGIGLELLLSLKIPCPPLHIQVEIAEHINTLRSKAENLKTLAKEVLQMAEAEIEGMLLAN